MNGNNNESVIDLLSSDDDENNVANAPKRGVNSNAENGNGTGTKANKRSKDEIIIDIDGDDQDDDFNVISHEPVSRHTIFNPYAKKRNPPSCDSPAIAATVRHPVENPYKKKKQSASGEKLKLAVNGDRETHNLSKSAKKKSAKQKSTREPHKNFLKHPPEERELQSGLVFEEDIDHITQFQKSKSLKQSSLRATGFVSYNNKHLAKLKNTDNKSQPDSDSDTSSDRETSTCPRPKSAQEYAQHQVTTRISHNLPPMLYHDPDFVAGDPATIDGIHTVNAVKKKGNKSANGKKSDCNEDNADESKSSISTTPPKCRCRPPKPCKLAYSSKAGPNYGRPFHCCPNSRPGGGGGCNYFSWAFTSYMLHWYRFGAHNGHLLVKPERGFRAEDLVQGILAGWRLLVPQCAGSCSRKRRLNWPFDRRQ